MSNREPVEFEAARTGAGTSRDERRRGDDLTRTPFRAGIHRRLAGSGPLGVQVGIIAVPWEPSKLRGIPQVSSQNPAKCTGGSARRPCCCVWIYRAPNWLPVHFSNGIM